MDNVDEGKVDGGKLMSVVMAVRDGDNNDGEDGLGGCDKNGIEGEAVPDIKRLSMCSRRANLARARGVTSTRSFRP